MISDIERSIDEWKLLNQRTLALKCGEYKLGAKGNKKTLAKRLHKRLHPKLYPLNDENVDPTLEAPHSNLVQCLNYLGILVHWDCIRH